MVDWVGYLRKYALSYWSNESGPKLFHAREHKLVYFTVCWFKKRGKISIEQTFECSEQYIVTRPSKLINCNAEVAQTAHFIRFSSPDPGSRRTRRHSLFRREERPSLQNRTWVLRVHEARKNFGQEGSRFGGQGLRGHVYWT